MPWKEEKDPYKVWLSEVILQQTKVEQGWSYYLNFIKNYPSIFDLANAPEEDVLKLWEGLGYYSRARNLHFSAKYIATELSGVFPKTYNEIIQLKGVGDYTAAAISSFVFKEKIAVVDGNVIRLLSRVFGITTAFDTSKGKKEFKNKANQLLDKKQPDIYNQAIMDFGATVCKAKLPLCKKCTFQKMCVAYQKELITELPFKSKRVKVKQRNFIAFHIQNENGYVLEQRTKNDIWKKLYQFPMFEVASFEKNMTKQSEELFEKEMQHRDFEIESISEIFQQKLTHRNIKVVFVKIKLKTSFNLLDNHLYTLNLTKFAFPKVFILYFQSKCIILD